MKDTAHESQSRYLHIIQTG